MEVRRTFDIIDWNIEKYPREAALSGKEETIGSITQPMTSEITQTG